MAALLQERLEVAEQRSLRGVVRRPVARLGDLVDADARLAGGAGVRADAGGGAVVLRDGEGDPLDGSARRGCRGAAPP